MKQIIVLLSLVLFSYGSIGQIVAYKGSAYVKRGYKKISIRVGTKLEKKDIVVTRNKTKLQIEFKDNTIITVGKNSKLKIDNYIFDDKHKEKSSFGISFIKGIFKSITGKIGKLNPEKFKLKTKTASIGIRGTRLIVNAKDKSTFVACTNGNIVVASLHDKKQIVNVDAGEFTTIQWNKAPTLPKEFTEENLNKIFHQYGGRFSQKFKKLKEKFPKKFTNIRTFKDFKKSVGSGLDGINSFSELKSKFPDDLNNINSLGEMGAVFGEQTQDIANLDLDNININILDGYLNRLDGLKKESELFKQENQ